MITTAENLKGVSGVYCVIHRDSGMCYVGSSIDMGHRIKTHRVSSYTKMTCFPRALREFGESAFDFEVIERCEQAVLHERERFWISFFNAASLDGFNTRKDTIPSKNNVVSDVTKARLRHAWTTRDHEMSAETRKKISEGNKGKKLTAEHRKKIGDAHRGRVHSDETRAATSARQKGIKRGPMSDATKKAMSESRKGKPLSEAHKEALRKSFVGRKRGVRRTAEERDAL